MSDYVSPFTISNTINGFSDKSSGGRKLRWHPFLHLVFYGHYRFHNLFLIFLYSLGEYPFSL